MWSALFYLYKRQSSQTKCPVLVMEKKPMGVLILEVLYIVNGEVSDTFILCRVGTDTLEGLYM